MRQCVLHADDETLRGAFWDCLQDHGVGFLVARLRRDWYGLLDTFAQDAVLSFLNRHAPARVGHVRTVARRWPDHKGDPEGWRVRRNTVSISPVTAFHPLADVAIMFSVVLFVGRDEIPDRLISVRVGGEVNRDGTVRAEFGLRLRVPTTG